ncbi:MAG TPA: sugar phosphate isomerase/epimerase family protein [Thermodesulfobacteriota bacterium]|nr:sugar phosphate isomerase/epimerase family protein [Thermodesulfobacteriota bacterium]
MNPIHLPPAKAAVLKKIHVNVPFPMLAGNTDAVLQTGLQPEIYFSGAVLDRISMPDVERTSEALARARVPVTFHGPFMDLNPGAVDDRVREITALRFRQVLDLAPYFHPRVIVLHPGYDRWRYDGDIDLWLEKSLLTLRPVVEAAGKASVKIALENVFDENPSALRTLLDTVDSPHLGYCMDAGHANLFSSMRPAEWLDVLGPRFMEIHLHDNDGQADDHLPLGRGNIDFSGLFSCIRAKGLNPVYTIEPHEMEYLLPNLETLEKYL